MLKRSVCAFLSLLTLLFCTVFLSCNFSEPNEVSTVSFVVNCDQLLSRNTASRSPDGLDSVKLVIALRGDYNDSQKVVFNPSTNKAEVSFKNIPVGSSVQALCCMTLDAYLMYVGYSDSVTLKKGENTISLKLIRPLNESILTSQAFALSQAENDDDMYILYTFKSEDSAAGSGNWIIYDVIKQRVFSFGLYNNLSKNTDQTVKSLSMTEYIYDGSNLGYQIVSTPKAQTITPSENSFKFISENGKELTFRVSGYIEAEETEASGTIEFPITADSFNISFDETKSSEGLYRNYYKIALKATDKAGNEITDGVVWNVKLLFGGKDINTTETAGAVVSYYYFDSETATITPVVSSEGLYKHLATSGPYQLYVTAEYGDNVYSSLVTLKIPDSYYYELSADEADLFTAVCSEIQNLKTTVTVKLTGTGDENTIGNLVSSINCSANLDLLETGITEIADAAFKWQSNLAYQKLLSVKLPKNLVSIGEEAFSDRSELTEITIPDTVTTIGAKAFYRCSSIKNLELPESVESLGQYAFAGMYSLTSMELPAAVSQIPNYLFADDGKLTGVLVKGGLTSIGNAAFSKCSELEDFEIPETVTSIGEDAFANCSKLSLITLPVNLAEINKNTFKNCAGLTSITIPSSVSVIENGAFQDCENLSELFFEENSNIKRIGESAFSGANLQTVSLPKSLIILDKYAFYRNSTLTQVSFESGSQLKGIGFRAFYETGLNGTDGKVTGLPSDTWKVIYYSDSSPGTSANTWTLVCKYYLGETITGDDKTTINNNSQSNSETLNDSYDFKDTANKDKYFYIEIQ